MKAHRFLAGIALALLGGPLALTAADKKNASSAAEREAAHYRLVTLPTPPEIGRAHV